jgi:hypothetical protein
MDERQDLEFSSLSLSSLCVCLESVCLSVFPRLSLSLAIYHKVKARSPALILVPMNIIDFLGYRFLETLFATLWFIPINNSETLIQYFSRLMIFLEETTEEIWNGLWYCTSPHIVTKMRFLESLLNVDRNDGGIVMIRRIRSKTRSEEQDPR